MNGPAISDKAHYVIIARMVETGQAPFLRNWPPNLGYRPKKAERLSMNYLPRASLVGFFPGPATLHLSLPSAICPHITALRLTANKNGLLNEGWKRWRSAGLDACEIMTEADEENVDHP